eukprot:TRINITY_DN11893_c0_g5_i1.p1 TRINITY_DN11893_c0_g5~~TRINITY_DN11893_c0_g5_i1.p1  ORF type:complete len:306 (+),score=34.12 TRINITY_DN11893_c0_g5_i1:487-1404(+)
MAVTQSNASSHTHDDHGVIPLLPSEAPSQETAGSNAHQALMQGGKHGRSFIPWALEIVRRYLDLSRLDEGAAPSPNQAPQGSTRAVLTLITEEEVEALCQTARILEPDSNFNKQVKQQLVRATAEATKLKKDHLDAIQQERFMSAPLCSELSKLLDVSILHQASLGKDNIHADGIGFLRSNGSGTLLEDHACVLYECKKHDLDQGSKRWASLFRQMANQWHRMLNTYKTPSSGVLQIATDAKRIVIYLIVPTIERNRPKFAGLMGLRKKTRAVFLPNQRLAVSVLLGEAAWDNRFEVARLLSVAR